MPYLSEPIAWRRPGDALELEVGLCRTLIVDDVGELDADEQTRLCEWLDGERTRVQVVSTNESALFSLVTRGLFDERLYYRLNVTLVKCRALATFSGGRKAADGRPLQMKDTSSVPTSEQHPSSAM